MRGRTANFKRDFLRHRLHIPGVSGYTHSRADDIQKVPVPVPAPVPGNRAAAVLAADWDAGLREDTGAVGHDFINSRVSALEVPF